MPICQASRLVGRQDLDAMEDIRLLVQTQFGKRLVLLNAIDAYELIPPKMDDEVHDRHSRWNLHEGVLSGGLP
jgi:hypothetical protein